MAIRPFGSVIRFGSTPGTSPQGIGGGIHNIWHHDTTASPNRNFLIDAAPAVFTVFRTGGGTTVWNFDIGGEHSTVWTVFWDIGASGQPRFLREIAASDISTVIRSVSPPTTGASGIGGKHNIVWHSETTLHRVYELSTTLGVIRFASSPSLNPWSIGGDAHFIYHCDAHTILIYELSTINFSVIRTSSPPTRAGWIGGWARDIWYCEPTINRIYELSTHHEILITRTSRYTIQTHPRRESTTRYEVMTPPRVSHTLAEVEMTEFNGATATPTRLTNLNFVSTDTPNATTPITTGEVSFEKWLRFRVIDFRDTIEISNLRFFCTGFIDGVLFSNVGIAHSIPFETPRNRPSFIAQTQIPQTLPSTQNLSVSGSLAGRFQPGRHRETDFIVLQLLTNPFIKEPINLEFNLVYDETI